MATKTRQVPASTNGTRTLEVIGVRGEVVEILERASGRERRLWPTVVDMRDAARSHPADHPYAILAEHIAEMIAANERAETERQRADAFRRLRDCPGHVPIRESEAWGYVTGVAVHPYTVEDRRAHGAIGVTETCRCGSTRAVLMNQRFRELSPWRATLRDGTVVK